MIVVGDPDHVVRKFEQFEKAGVSQVIFFKQSGRIPHQTIMRSLRLIAKHVLPHFNPHRTIAGEQILVGCRRPLSRRALIRRKKRAGVKPRLFIMIRTSATSGAASKSS
jgi:hypothetical protein